MGRLYPPVFCGPRSAEELTKARDAIAAWSRLTWGWRGRSPDYKAAFLATLGDYAEFYEPYQENARRWYRYAQERVPYLNHAIVHPPVDRNMAPGAAGGPTDIYAHVTRETDGGIYFTDAKVVATGSALTHFTFVAHVGLLPIEDRRFALAFIIAAGAPTFAQFETEKIRKVNNKDRTSAAKSVDFRYLTDLYADENDDLRGAIATKTQENDTLQQNIEALTNAVRSAQTAPIAQQVTDGAPPTSVAEAVQIARTTLGDLLAFPREIDAQVEMWTRPLAHQTRCFDILKRWRSYHRH